MNTTKFHSKKALILAVSQALLLAGCGGGGGAGGDMSLPNNTSSNNPNSQEISSVDTVQNKVEQTSAGSEAATAAQTAGAYQTAAFRAQSFHKRAALASGLNGAGVKVGISDTGIDFSSDLAKSILPAVPTDQQLNLVAPDQNLQDYGDGHTTGVLYTIAGQETPLNRGGMAPSVVPYIAAVGSTDSLTHQGGPEWDWFKQNGVSIVNNSWAYPGSDTAPKASSVAAFASRIKPYINDGMLFVFATGNQGTNQPGGGFNLAPLNDPSLQKGLIVVTSVSLTDPLSNQTTPTLASNKCGVAAQWCLTGINESYHADVASNSVTVWYGTSIATPFVTSAAALLKQKYPWASNDVLRTTLLTTASDIGAPGVDSVYGWGLLNVDKALKGPSQFAFGDLTTNVTPGTYSFDNDISGQGGLIKEGDGTLVLNGDNTYAGKTTINHGVLSISGSVISTINVNAAGTLNGKGHTVNVNNNGLFINEGLNITGNYVQGAAATLQTALGQGLTVQGKASLDGSLVFTKPADVFAPASGTSVAVINANGGLQGQFKNVSTSGLLYDANLNYGKNSLSATVSAKKIADVVSSVAGQAGNQAELVNTAQSLDNLIANTSEQSSSTRLHSLAKIQGVATSAGLSATLRSINGSIYTNSLKALANTNKDARQQQTFSIFEATEQASLAVSGGKLKDQYREDDLGFDSTSNKYTIDYKQKLNPMLRVSASLSRLNGNSSQNDGGVDSKSKMSAVSANAMIQYGADEGAFASAGLGYTQGNIDVNRSLYMGTADSTENTGHLSTSILSTQARVGYAVKPTNNSLVAGFAGINNDRVSINHFTEQGTSLPFSADSQSFNLPTALFGVYASYNDIANSGIDLEALYMYEKSLFGKKSLNGKFDGSDVSLNANSFNNNRNSQVISIRASFEPLKNTRLGLGMSRQWMSHSKQFSANVGAEYRF